MAWMKRRESGLPVSRRLLVARLLDFGPVNFASCDADAFLRLLVGLWRCGGGQLGYRGIVIGLAHLAQLLGLLPQDLRRLVPPAGVDQRDGLVLRRREGVRREIRLHLVVR